MSTTIEATLAERGARYGTFADNARVAQEIKESLRTGPNWSVMTADQREALDMLAAKMSRIVTGDPQYLDNWHDIVGYTKLVEDRMVAEVAEADAALVAAARRPRKKT